MDETQPPRPDLLDLYRLAVQHPLAEVGFIERCWAHYHGESAEPLLLREDFAGTCAVAAAWARSDPDRQAMAVELHEPTAQWAAERFDDEDLHIVVDDVMAVDGPEVDVTLALNFSALIYHDHAALQAYFAHALGGLNPGGLLILDVFGGSGTSEPVVDRRRVEPDEGGAQPFDYVWDQGAVDQATGRIDCRIHFELGDGRRLADAFVYHWRLWRPEQLVAAAVAAGFAQAEVWWAASGTEGSEGRYQPTQAMPGGEGWVAYVVCRAEGTLR